MTAADILADLMDIDTYLALTPPGQKESTYFEILIAKAVAEIFKIPYFCVDNDDVTICYKVVWNGTSRSQITPAPGGKCDAFARCHDFYLAIEATSKPGTNQWTQEFASSISHLEEMISKKICSRTNSYILFVAKKISDDTFLSLKRHPQGDLKFIPLNLASFAKILKTTEMAYTIKHLDIRQLLLDVPKILRESENVNDYEYRLNNHVVNWRKEIFKRESNAIVGIKSYEIMRSMNRQYIGESEILSKLLQSNDIVEYLNAIGEKITAQRIEDSLEAQNLIAGRMLNSALDGDMFFQPVPYFAYKERQCRIIKLIKTIDEGSAASHS